MCKCVNFCSMGTEEATAEVQRLNAVIEDLQKKKEPPGSQRNLVLQVWRVHVCNLVLQVWRVHAFGFS